MENMEIRSIMEGTGTADAEDYGTAQAEMQTDPTEPAADVETTEEETTAAEEPGDGGEIEGGKDTDSADDIDALIAEAEARGYQRGRNEKIEEWINEGRRGREGRRNAPAESEVMILNNMRKSIWE